MEIVDILGFISVAVCFVASGWMVIWCDYNDGIIGKIALGMIGIGCLSILIELTEGVTSRFTPVRVMITGGMAVFLVRHLWRSWRFHKGDKYQEPTK